MRVIVIAVIALEMCGVECFEMGNGRGFAAGYHSAAMNRAQAYHHYCVAIGRGAVSTTNNQLVIATQDTIITAPITTGEWSMIVSILRRATEARRERDWFNRVFDAICAQEDPTGEYAGKVHRDGVSYGRCGITQVAVQDCITNGYLPPGVYGLTDPAMADWCGRQYLRLLVKRHGSLWAAVCRWNKGREAYAAKVWRKL